MPNLHLFKSALVTTVSSLLFACAGKSAEPAPATQQSGGGDLAAALEQRNNLLASLEATPAEQRRRCEIEVGDCRLDVNDARDKILRAHPSAKCRSASDSNHEIECVVKELAQSGEAGVASGYYRKESWCLQRMVKCADKMAMAAIDASRKAQIDQRKSSLEASRRASEARALATFAVEKVNYLRGLLPPGNDDACSDAAALEACEAGTSARFDEYEKLLATDDGSYKEQSAIQLYEAAHKAKAQCQEPTFKCLAKRLDGLGGTQETRHLMAQTLSALKRRQVLIDQVGDENAEACLSSGIQKLQGRIVEDYQRFVREPVLFFQAQLHKDFRRLYEAQASCLKGAQRSGARPVASVGPKELNFD